METMEAMKAMESLQHPISPLDAGITLNQRNFGDLFPGSFATRMWGQRRKCSACACHPAEKSCSTAMHKKA